MLLRAHRRRRGRLLGGYARTAEAAQLIATGWAKPLAADRQTVRASAPMVRTAGDDAELARDEAAKTARMPGLALRTAREALADGPVLFQVPRSGYLAAVACQLLRHQDPVQRVRWPGSAVLARTGSCAAAGAAHQRGQGCQNCGGTGIRAAVTGERRTAEELSRAFPGVPVRTSSGPEVLAAVPDAPAIVIATPGAEPRARGWLRRRDPAGRLGVAGQAEPAGRGGSAAPLDERRRTGTGQAPAGGKVIAHG